MAWDVTTNWGNQLGAIRPTVPGIPINSVVDANHNVINNSTYGNFGTNTNGIITGPSGINILSPAGDSPYLSEALSGITGPNSVGIAQNRYGVSVTLPTNSGIDTGFLASLIGGGENLFATPKTPSDAIFQNQQQYTNATAGLNLLAQKQAGTIQEQLAALQTAGALQSNGANFEIMGTEFKNAHSQPSTLQQILNGVTQFSGAVAPWFGVPSFNNPQSQQPIQQPNNPVSNWFSNLFKAPSKVATNQQSIYTPPIQSDGVPSLWA